MTQGKYRVGIVGCGSTANFCLEGWKAAAERADVVALCDIVPEQMSDKQRNFPETCGDAATFTDYREMLGAAELDIVCILAHGDTRLEHAEACLKAGKHLFIEKPVGYTPEEARRFKFLAHKYPERKVAVAYSLRYRNEWMDARGVIDSGIIGTPYAAQITYCHPCNFANPGSRHPTTDKIGNYIASSTLVHATHPWDLARYLLGEVREVFYASGGNINMGTLWMESGALCQVMSGSQPSSKVAGNNHQFLQVHGDQGSCWIMRDIYEPHEVHTLYRRSDGDMQEAPPVTDEPNSSHGVIIRTHNLLNAIEGKAELLSSMEDGARTTDLLHALWLSQRTQVKVPVLEAGHTG